MIQFGNRFSKENIRLLIGAGIVILFVTADLFLVFFPLIRKSYALKGQIVLMKKDMTTLKQQIASVDDTKKKLESLRAEQALYEKRFPKEEEISALLSSLSSIAAKSGVSIIGVKPLKSEAPADPKKAATMFHEITLEVSARGGYHQIGQFINKIEGLDRFMDVRDMDISQNSATPRIHNLRLTLVTYILRI